MQKKNLFSSDRGIKRSLNYRLGILVNSFVTAKKIWSDRHIISHIFSQTLRPSNIFIIGLACRISQCRGGIGKIFVGEKVFVPYN